MARARNHINVLEENMSLLMAQANANESLVLSPLHLQGTTVAATSLDDMLMRFHRWARELGLAGATVRLFPGSLASRRAVKLYPSGVKPPGLRTAAYSAAGAGAALSGHLKRSGIAAKLPEAKAIGSVAMSMLGRDGDLASFCSAAATRITIRQARERNSPA